MVLEDGCVREGLSAFLAGVGTCVGVDSLVANPLAAIVKVAVAVRALIRTLARMAANVGSKLAHLAEGFVADSEFRK